MTQLNVPTITAQYDDIKDFMSFIEKCESDNVSGGRGVFKVSLQSEETLTEPMELLNKLRTHIQTSGFTPVKQHFQACRRDSNLFGWRQNIVGQGSDVAEAFIKLLTKEDLFSPQHETCCTQALQKDKTGNELLAHYFEVLHSIADPPKSSSCNYSKDQIEEMISAGETLRNVYEGTSVSTGNTDNKCINERPSRKAKSKLPFQPRVKRPWASVRQSAAKALQKKHPAPHKSNYDNPIYGSALQLDENQIVNIMKDFTLSKLKNLLDIHPDKYAGLSHSYFYIGTCHSTFALHGEDAALWSINYLHLGAIKIWIVIPPEYVERLKLALYGSDLLLEHTSCHNILGHKYAIIDPAFLDSFQIPYSVVVQHPGELVILHPNAVHQGFNLGYNIAEAINFATVSWIPHGLRATVCGCFGASQIHLDMSPFLAMYHPELLETYIAGRRFSDIPAGKILNESEKTKTLECAQPILDEDSETSEGHVKDVEDRLLLQCIACPKVFKGGRGKLCRLLYHCKKEHPTLQNIEEKTEIKYAPKEGKMKKKFTCPDCGLQVAGTPANLKRHQNRKH